MKISYNWLQYFFQKKLPNPEKLADLLTMYSFETEIVSKSGQDTILDIDVLPNRAHDCFSHKGIAREISVLLGYVFNPIDYGKKLKEDSKELANKLVSVKIEEKELCPRYTARVVSDVKIEPSPQWIQERLRICGLRPINNVVDITNYAMLETGQPLHAFDADKLISSGNSKKIIVRRAKKGEKMVSLDDEKYDLDENILVIADEKNPVCIAGIKGGKNPEIDAQTKNIIIEGANFNYQIIRSASKQLKLETDASWRFERRIDPNLTQEGINMAAYLIQELAQGKILKGVVDVYPIKTKTKTINLDTEYVRKLLGIDITDKEITDILRRLDLDKDIPTRRLDISIQEDLIEEIGRIYGFEKIPSELPKATLIPPIKNDNLFYQNKVKDILVNIGFSDVYNYSFISEKDISDFKLIKKDLIKIANPVSQDQKYLRVCLAVNLLKNVRDNKKYFKGVRLFEIGKVFQKKQVKESRKIGAILALDDNNNQAQEFYRLKGVIDSLLNKLRISDIWYDDVIEKGLSIPEVYHSDRRAQIKVGNEYLGWLGEVSKQVLDSIGIESRVAYFEIHFDKLVELATEERIYSSPSKYPSVVRDIALLVDKGTKIVKVMNLINSSGGALIKDINLFDMYEGENIPDNKKNLAFHIIYQSDDHTLTDKEVNKVHEKVIKALKEEGGWEIRE